MSDQFAWTCSICEKTHLGLPALAYPAPSHYCGIPEGERKSRAKLTDDFCVIDNKAFYIRCVLFIPVKGLDTALEWGVWSSLSQESFRLYHDTFNDHDQGSHAPMFGWFASALPKYENTLILRCSVIPQNNRKRPVIEFDPSQAHPLVNDQREGISADRALEFAAIVMHKH